MDPPRIRIGELSRRTGVSPVLLRAWETRYGLITPERSPGGTRLYSLSDVTRVSEMRAHIASGVAAAEAATQVRRGVRAPAAGALEEIATGTDAMTAAFRALDGGAADRALEALLAAFPYEAVATQVLLPYLNDVGRRWALGEASIAEEHLATNVIRSRLLAIARTPSERPAGAFVLACPPDELHDLPLVFLAVGLARRGWHFMLLGANTPIAAIAEAADEVDCEGIVLSAIDAERFNRCASELAALSAHHRVLMAGPATTATGAASIGATWLAGDPVTGAVEELVGATAGPSRT